MRGHKQQRYIHIFLWGMIFVLGFYIIIKGTALIGETYSIDIKTKMLGTIKENVDKHAVETYMPAFTYAQYGDALEDSLEHVVFRKVIDSFPLLGYLQDSLEYETQIEDSAAHAMIVMVEGYDENLPEVLEGEEPEEDQNAAELNLKAHAETETSAEAETEPEAVQAAKVTDISRDKLKDYNYLLNSFYILDKTVGIDSDMINAEKFLNKDLSIEKNKESPQILIYHTHSQEEFIDSVPGDPSTSIVGVGAYLTEVLEEQYGYNVLHHTGVYDLVDGVLDRNYAYTLALPAIEQILQENPSIEVVIDLHRDGVDGKKFVTEVNGKPTAQFMLLNGVSRSAKNGEISYLPNPYVDDNLAFSFQLKLKAEEYYPGLTRGIYLRSLRYNLHLAPRTILVESGTQLNTVQEQKNAMEPLAEILNQVLMGE